jgi:(p)ppGpp synthase/HD superfamily hydrolase
VSLVADAVALADRLHAGQLDKGDKGGEPYIGHPLRVMGAVRSRLDRQFADVGVLGEMLNVKATQERAEAAAVLHDVLEDTQLTAEALALEVGVYVSDLVEKLTRRTGEPYDAYITRLAESREPLVLIIKLADLQDNLDPVRLERVAPRLRRKLERRYLDARQALTAALAKGERDVR